MGRCFSKETIRWRGSNKASGTMSNRSKKIVQKMWTTMKLDSTNFAISVLIRQVHQQNYFVQFFHFHSPPIFYMNQADMICI